MIAFTYAVLAHDMLDRLDCSRESLDDYLMTMTIFDDVPRDSFYTFACSHATEANTHPNSISRDEFTSICSSW